MSSPALEIDGGEERGQETGEVETADPGGDDEVESIVLGGHDDVESIGPEGQEVEAEAPPPAARRPQHVAELADFNTNERENDEVREGKTHAANQQSVSGLVATLGPISASEIMYVLLAEQRAGDAVELPKELVQRC